MDRMEDLDARCETGIGFTEGEIFRVRHRRDLYRKVLHCARAVRRARAMRDWELVELEQECMLSYEFYYHIALWDTPA